MKKLHVYYFYFIAICFAFLFCKGSLIGQGKNQPLIFPQSWSGDWAGILTIYQPGNDSVQTLPMELNIHPLDSTDRWQWQIVYITEGEKAPRNYELFEVDVSKGHYAIDEQNSIILDSYLIGGVLVSRFSVQTSLLIITYRLEGEELVFEIFMGNNEKTTQTGGESEIPEVLSYSFGVRQVARLKRK